MTKSDPNLEEALILIEELSQALSHADTSASEVNRSKVQRALDFLTKHGRMSPVFE